MKRCDWAIKDSFSQTYHDQEWCEITHDEQKIFEFIVLESMQAGLNWATILKKRKAFQEAFDNFDYRKIAHYDEAKFDSLMNDAGIIRNKLKIKATINNANCFLEVQKEFGSFDHYIWQFVNFQPIINSWTVVQELPAKTELSDLIAKDLKKRGFKFLGSTIVYSFLQGIGIIDDHLVDCYKKTSRN